MSQGRSRWGSEFETKVDMTPMIDVVFNLLVFFMCTLRIVTLDGQFAAELPRDAGPGDGVTPPLDPMTIAISHDPASGRATFRAGRTITEDPDALVSAISSFVRSSPGLAVEIAPDRGVPYRHVITALDACTEARAPEVRFSGVSVRSK